MAQYDLAVMPVTAGPSVSGLFSYFSFQTVFGVIAGLVIFHNTRRAYDSYRFEKEQLLSDIPFSVFLIKTLCLQPLSVVWGYIMDIHIPKWARVGVYSAYAYVTSTNLTEVAQELTYYQSINEFFTRDLKAKSRTIDPALLISPADALVTDLQTINVTELRAALEAEGKLDPSSTCDAVLEHIRLSKVKDCRFIASDFLGIGKCPTSNSTDRAKSAHANTETDFGHLHAEEKKKNPKLSYTTLVPDKIEQLSYITLYMSPGDCHQFFYPTHMNMSTIQHFSGELMPVAPAFLNFVCSGLALNERVLCMGHWELGRFSMTLVGATSMGRIKVYGDQSHSRDFRNIYDMNPTQADISLFAKNPMECKKGGKMGYFEMGSSIVLIFDSKGFEFTVKPNERVKIGQAIGRKIPISY